jgi:hypothetical protein
MFPYFQFLFGEKHVIVFLEDFKAEMWQLRLCSTPSNFEYFV